MASQRVMELQASKKQLAGVLLSQHDGEADDRLGSLHVSGALGLLRRTYVVPFWLLTLRAEIERFAVMQFAPAKGRDSGGSA